MNALNTSGDVSRSLHDESLKGHLPACVRLQRNVDKGRTIREMPSLKSLQ